MGVQRLSLLPISAQVVTVSSPGISIPAESVFLASCNCPDLGLAVVGSVLWSRKPSLSSAATVLTSKNHLTVVVNGSMFFLNDVK